MVWWLSVAFMVALGLDAAFWFSVDFSTFVPPCDGPLAERALFTAVTASGPLAMVINGHFSNLLGSLVVSCGLCGGLIARALLRRESVLALIGGYCGIALWFFFGFAVAGLRIT